MMTGLSSQKRKQRGIAAVEAALLVIPLLILMFGIIDGGRALFEYNSIVKAARDSARYLSTVEAGHGYAEARCLAVHGSTDCNGAKILESLDVANVEICDAVACGCSAPACLEPHKAVPSDGNGGPQTGVLNLVTVAVTKYQFTSIIGVAFPSVEFGPISVTMRQAL